MPAAPSTAAPSREPPLPSARIALLRTRWWVERMHLPALLSHPGVELVARCGRDPERGGRWPAAEAVG